MMAGRQYRLMIEDIFGDIGVEDTWRPFFCVSTNLTKAVPMIHDHGSLTLSLRATAAIPGCYPPIKYGNDLLVDGATRNNLPVDLVPRYMRGKVIAINVMAHPDTRGHATFREEDNILQSLWRRLSPLERELQPIIFDLLMQTVFLTTCTKTGEIRAASDLYLDPPVDNYDLFDTGAIDLLIDNGYQYARDRLAEWKASNTPHR